MVFRAATEPTTRYLRAPRPLVFPTGETVPETRRHFGIRTALFQVLEAAFGDRATLGSDQFVYWDPTDPKACCAPDVMLRFGEPDAPFDSWKVWERGAPHLAVEVTSAADAEDGPWEQKLERYRRMGVGELVRFDADEGGRPIRIWDFLEGDLVERDPTAVEFARSRVLDAYFCVRDDAKLGAMLRLAKDPEGENLYLTPTERVRELERELERRR